MLLQCHAFTLPQLSIDRNNSRANVPKEQESDIRDIFITGRSLKRCVFKISEHADMRSGDLVLKVVMSSDV